MEAMAVAVGDTEVAAAEAVVAAMAAVEEGMAVAVTTMEVAVAMEVAIETNRSRLRKLILL
jgi:hypothetical protein